MGSAWVAPPPSGSRLQFDQPFANGQNRGLGPVIHLQFVKDIANVVFYRLLTEIQIVGDFFVGLPVCDEAQDSDFAFGQIVFHPSRLFPLFSVT
jgi:hypothetical protein